VVGYSLTLVAADVVAAGLSWLAVACNLLVAILLVLAEDILSANGAARTLAGL